MGSLNKVMVIGNLGSKPEMKSENFSVTNFSLACNEAFKNKETGEWDKRTEWIDVVAFGKTAENVCEYLDKGRQVYVEGRLQTRSYEKDGVKKYRTEVIANKVIFLGGGSGSTSTKDLTEQDLPF